MFHSISKNYVVNKSVNNDRTVGKIVYVREEK